MQKPMSKIYLDLLIQRVCLRLRRSLAVSGVQPLVKMTQCFRVKDGVILLDSLEESC